MKKVFVIYGKEPILDIDKDGMGLHRDKIPDSGWGELRRTNINMCMDKIKEVDLNDVKQTLLEDLAFAYGSDSAKFCTKLKEFGLV